ncbi:hypothetical protein AJ80_09513, partial [Polytolypa hystricis UAMH7299]
MISRTQTRRQTARQACDACRRRKVKCDSREPCLHCRRACLACTYLSVPQKKGRQGDKANVLSELRAAQATNFNIDALEGAAATTASVSPTAAAVVTFNSGNQVTVIPSFPTTTTTTTTPPRPLEFVGTSDLLPRDIVHECIELFLSHLQTTVPILDRDQLQQELIHMHESTESYCLVVCVCAFVIIQTGTVRPPALRTNKSASAECLLAECLVYGQRLLDEALEARRHLDILSQPSDRIITITFFLYCCHVGLNHQKQAWFFLREATTLYMSGPVELDPAAVEPAGLSVWNRLFWLLLISERAHAIRRRRPITLQITPDSPAANDQANEELAASGFGYLASFFRPFDETFLSLWNRTHSVCSAVSLVNLETHIQGAVPPSLDASDEQLANLRITQQWLRTIIWQLSTTLGFLSSNSVHECMTFRYPIQIARDLAFATWKLPNQSMEIHGLGL